MTYGAIRRRTSRCTRPQPCLAQSFRLQPGSHSLVEGKALIGYYGFVLGSGCNRHAFARHGCGGWTRAFGRVGEDLVAFRASIKGGNMQKSSAKKWKLVFTLLATISASSVLAQQLPPGGTTSWEIQGPEEIVTFVLFDPKTPGVSLPAGLRFVHARDVKMPEVQEYLKQYPDHAEWAFSIIEIARHKAFLLDGKEPTFAENAGIGLWFAPVDPSHLAEEIGKDKFDSIIAPSLGAVLGLGLWIPDREYVDYMRARGHHAEYGMVTLMKDSTGVFRGEIRLDDLYVQGSVTPRGDVREDPEAGTQVLFAPGETVVYAVVIAGSDARHRDCSGDWSKKGEHPLARGVFVGPTYLTTYDAPLKGSAYRLREEKKQ